MAHVVAAVVVQPQRVDGAGDLGQVTVPDVAEIAHRRQVLEHVVGVGPSQQRVVPQAVGDAVDPAHGRGRRRPPASRSGGNDRVGVERDPDLRALVRVQPRPDTRARSASMASPCPSNRWWAAATAAIRLGASGGVYAGAVTQHVPYQGSLIVVHRRTRSPRASATTAA